MLPIKIDHSHVELGREQGFVPLHIRFEITQDTGTGQQYPSMLCALQPTEKEIADIVAGQPVILRILGIDWPPVMVTVGDEFDQLSADLGVKYVQHVMRERRAADGMAPVSEAEHAAMAHPVAGSSEQQ